MKKALDDNNKMKRELMMLKKPQTSPRFKPGGGSLPGASPRFSAGGPPSLAVRPSPRSRKREA